MVSCGNRAAVFGYNSMRQSQSNPMALRFRREEEDEDLQADNYRAHDERQRATHSPQVALTIDLSKVFESSSIAEYGVVVHELYVAGLKFR